MSDPIQTRHDAIVVGSGPGGGCVARELARAGMGVLILERGADWRGHPLYGSNPGALLNAERHALLFSREGMQIVRPLMVGGATSMFAGCAAPPPPWLAERYGVDVARDAADIAAELGVAPLPSELRGAGSTLIAEAGRSLGMSWVPQDKFMRAARARAFECGAHCLLGCRCGAKWNAGELVDDAIGAGAELRTRARVARVIVERGAAVGVGGRSRDGPCEARAPIVINAGGGHGTPMLQRTAGIAAGGSNAKDTTEMV
jgi:choline dehydrogenase-like flavoprotein